MRSSRRRRGGRGGRGGRRRRRGGGGMQVRGTGAGRSGGGGRGRGQKKLTPYEQLIRKFPHFHPDVIEAHLVENSMDLGKSIEALVQHDLRDNSTIPGGVSSGSTPSAAASSSDDAPSSGLDVARLLPLSDCKCKFTELDGNLFSSRESEWTVAHCVSADLAMGAGIAVEFVKRYGRCDVLKAQKVGIGGVAVLKGIPPDRQRRTAYESSPQQIERRKGLKHKTLAVRNSRPKFIRPAVFYMITKGRYFNIPQYAAVWSSLLELRRLCCDEGLSKKLALPEIACGLDRLDWKIVSSMIWNAFAEDADMEIVVYHYDPPGSKKKKKPGAGGGRTRGGRGRGRGRRKRGSGRRRGR